MENVMENENLENELSNENRRSTVTIKSRSPVKLNVSVSDTLRWEKIRRVLLAVVLIFLASYQTYYAYDMGYAEGLKEARAVDSVKGASDTRLFRFHPRLEMLLSEFLLAVAFSLYFLGYLRGEQVHDSSGQRDPDVSLVVRANECLLLDVDYEVNHRRRRFSRLLNFLNSGNVNENRNARNRDGFIVGPD